MACEKHGEDCSPIWEEYWPKFVEGMHDRFRTGHEEYTDKVFSRDPLELMLETLQEAEDIIGWGFILRFRLQKLIANAREWYPAERANTLLASARGQSDNLIAENMKLRQEIVQLQKRVKDTNGGVIRLEGAPTDLNEPDLRPREEWEDDGSSEADGGC